MDGTPAERETSSAVELLTNARLYSSFAPKSVSLSDIILVSFEDSTFLQKFILNCGPIAMLFREQLYPKLLVNGDVFYRAPKKSFLGTTDFEFWIELLSRLGKM